MFSYVNRRPDLLRNSFANQIIDIKNGKKILRAWKFKK